MEATIGPATVPDYPAMLALLRRCGLPEAGLAAHMGAALVARAGGAVVGCAALELYGEAALLRSVAVDAAWRGRGLGRALVEAALDLARRRGVGEVSLLTETAADFFPRFGFRPVERAAVAAPVRGSVELTAACPA
jgi:amino-acid N-acetyltransferase